ncbi:unnamed protein product, partial [Caretta caretta]
MLWRVYNEVVSLLAHMDDQDKGKIALRIAFIAETKLAIVLTVLLEKLQKDEQNRVDIYCVLEKVLQQDTQGLERRLLKKIITLASNHMRETQSLKCIPFVGMILNGMISMLELVEDSRMRQAFCGVLEKCSRAVNGYFMNWEKCSFPRMGESRFCNQILPLYCHVTSNWLTCEELETEAGHHQSPWSHDGHLTTQKGASHKIRYLRRSHGSLSNIRRKLMFFTSPSLSQLLEVSVEYKIPLPKGKFQAICSALHNQICSPAKQLSRENHKELFHCVLLL